MAVTADAARVVVARARNGYGLFATKSFRTGETITGVDGRRVHHSVLWRRQGTRFAANCFRFGPDTYLDPGDGPCRFINHSCEPNAGIGKTDNRLLLFAGGPIRRGSEITIDYSTTIGDDDIWTMRCNCGSRRCRRRIRNFGTLPSETRRSYVARGLVPGFILRTLVDPISTQPRRTQRSLKT